MMKISQEACFSAHVRRGEIYAAHKEVEHFPLPLCSSPRSRLSPAPLHGAEV